MMDNGWKDGCVNLYCHRGGPSAQNATRRVRAQIYNQWSSASSVLMVVSEHTGVQTQLSPSVSKTFAYGNTKEYETETEQ